MMDDQPTFKESPLTICEGILMWPDVRQHIAERFPGLIKQIERVVSNHTEIDAQAQTIAAQDAEIERLLEVERENALKLKQILDLEETLYATSILSMDDGSPCWCEFPSFESGPHSGYCMKAREASRPMWKHEALQPQEAENETHA